MGIHVHWWSGPVIPGPSMGGVAGHVGPLPVPVLELVVAPELELVVALVPVVCPPLVVCPPPAPVMAPPAPPAPFDDATLPLLPHATAAPAARSPADAQTRTRMAREVTGFRGAPQQVAVAP